MKFSVTLSAALCVLTQAVLAKSWDNGSGTADTTVTKTITNTKTICPCDYSTDPASSIFTESWSAWDDHAPSEKSTSLDSVTSTTTKTYVPTTTWTISTSGTTVVSHFMGLHSYDSLTRIHRPQLYQLRQLPPPRRHRVLCRPPHPRPPQR